MANILYMTISQDGFIAGDNDETPWSEESWRAFGDFVKTCDVILLGRRTFEIMQAGDEFVAGPRYIVVTNNPAVDTGDLEKVSIHSAEDIPKAKRLGIIGGGALNGQLAKLGQIDEVILDIQPVKLGSGIKLFGGYDSSPKLNLVSEHKADDGATQSHYLVERD